MTLWPHVSLCVSFYSMSYVLCVCASFKGMCWVTVARSGFPDWVPAHCRFPSTSPSISHSITPSISLSHQPGTRHPARILWWQKSTLPLSMHSYTVKRTEDWWPFCCQSCLYNYTGQKLIRLTRTMNSVRTHSVCNQHICRCEFQRIFLCSDIGKTHWLKPQCFFIYSDPLHTIGPDISL